ncbi:MAG TPA: TetR/AcrR family transcriptional regulator [Vicinamibacterales bacterium]|nr:TetR/AcrR family transcriptional regulator [Vicinamibacterales bacterium]
MVSRSTPNGTSRERLFAAAAAEFAAKGFDGAKVDRIAARARINKAMLYYHFHSKAALYRDILRQMFGTVAGAVTAVHEQGGPADAQLRRFIEAIALAAEGSPHFPAMWLREIAEGGRHLDESIVHEMRRVIETLGRILHEGRQAGIFGPVNPFVTQIGIVAPLMFFSASAPIRERFRHLMPTQVVTPRREDVVAHVQATTLAALASPGTQRARASSRSSRRSARAVPT